MDVKELLEDLNAKSDIKEKLERLQNLYDVATALEIDFKNNEIYKVYFSEYATALSSGKDARTELENLIKHLENEVDYKLANIKFDDFMKSIRKLNGNWEERKKENDN